MNTISYFIIYFFNFYRYYYYYYLLMKVFFTSALADGTIYQPLRSGRIWHKVNF